MRNTSLIAAAAIVVIANALTLMHAARNRAGSPEAEITLTERELRYYGRSATDDDSGVTLNLQWTDLSGLRLPGGEEGSPVWLDSAKLRTLGFDCSMSPANPAAENFYRRQRSRRVFAALEFEGAAWRAWREGYDRAVAQAPPNTVFSDTGPDGSRLSSHLSVIDADGDPAQLRARHPDRGTVLILPAVIGVVLDRGPGGSIHPVRPAEIRGNIRQLPASIHVPVPFSEGFRRLTRPDHGAFNINVPYRVRVRYGASLEPWVIGVDFVSAR